MTGRSTLLGLALACAWAAPAAAHPDDGDADGDVRPAARAILEAAAAAPAPLTLGAARARGLVAADPSAAAAFDPPAVIRVWRRGLDGSSSSCSGRVDEIDFTTYVKSVLPHEWIRSWEDASLQTGAIVIRTYAAWWVNAGGKYDCADLDDTTASQVYKDEFFPETDAAVDATAGLYVVDAGADLVFAEYSAENGDPTALGVSDSVCAGHAVNGHGRGTCQWGSQRWALQGQPADWIATHYYPGSSLLNVTPTNAATLGAADYRAELVAGEEMVVWVEYTNDGNTTWTPDATLLGTTGPRDRDSAFAKPENWLSASRPTGVDQATAPGEVARFSFVMVAPDVAETTTFTESFALVTAEGAWFGPADDAVSWTITVTPRDPNNPDPNDPDPDDPNGTHSGGCSAGAAGGGALLVACIALIGVRRRRRTAPILAVLSVLAVAGACSPPGADPRPAPRVAVGGESPLVGAFLRAGADTGVPAELLAAVSYVETRFRFAGGYAPLGRDDHGVPAIGLLALSEGGSRDIARAAELAGLDEALVHTDVDANLHAGAALLVAAAPDARRVMDFRDALVEFTGGGATGADFANEVYKRLASGFTGTDADGLSITVSARPEAAPVHTGFGTAVQAMGYPGAIWNPASTSNYQAASRGADSINYIVIHTVQGSYSGCISWFKNPAAEVSSHYVVRSSDGEVTQMVDDSDVAWHDACFNSQSIGIEHEGYVDDPGTWYTESMYTESAKLTAWIADSYGIPKDRSHIYGHGDAPDCSDHTDPGPGWDWAHYMDLVNNGGMPQFNATEGALDYPADMVSGEEAVVFAEFVNGGNTTWDIDQTRIGTAEPEDRTSAFFVDGNWLGPNRPSGADHSNYTPGATGRFTWVMRAPAVDTTTTFDEAFQLVQEGVAWFGPVVHMSITVHPVGGEPDPDPDPDPGEGGDEDQDPPPDDGANAGCSAAGGSNGVPLAIGCAMLLACARRRRRAR